MSKSFWAFSAAVGLIFYSARLVPAALDVDGDISDWVAADLVQMAGDPFDISGFGYSYGQPGGNVITRWGAAVEDEVLYVFIEAEKVLADYDFPAEIGGGRNYLWLNIDVDNSQSLDTDSMLGGLYPEQLMPGVDITVQIGDDHGSPLTTHFWYQGVGDIMEHDGSDVSSPGSWTYSGRILEFRAPLDDLLAELASYPDQTPAGPWWNVAPSFEGNYGDWSMHRAPTVVICSGVPVFGDFDDDGNVDGADFLKWQRGEVSNPPSAEDLALWENHFGNTSTLLAAASIPEPSSIMLLLVDSAKLQSAISYLEANSPPSGVESLAIIRNGRMMWKGSSIDKMYWTASAVKSVTSTMLGLLIDDGMVMLDTPIKDYVPMLAEDYPDATLRHFATMTSGYPRVV